MSYCVNCGVELDKTCSTCPLCHTKVYNPNQPVDTESPTPYPIQKGEEEPVHRYEFTILVTIIFITTALVCSTLNTYVFTKTQWSLYVVGACIVAWFIMLPLFFPGETNPFTNLLLDGISLGVYFYVISQHHPGNGWYTHIVLPIIIMVTVAFQINYLFAIKLKSSMIRRSVVFLFCVGIFCGILDLLIDFHFDKTPVLSWGAIVLTCCISANIILITIACLKGVRNELRRRVHF